MERERVYKLIAKIGKTDKAIYKEGNRFYNKRYDLLKRTESAITSKILTELATVTLKKILSMKRNKHHD